MEPGNHTHAKDHKISERADFLIATGFHALPSLTYAQPMPAGVDLAALSASARAERTYQRPPCRGGAARWYCSQSALGTGPDPHTHAGTSWPQP